jgi:hypothetical protein
MKLGLRAKLVGTLLGAIVISSAISARTRQAVARVGELNEVAAGLDELVNGSK